MKKHQAFHLQELQINNNELLASFFDSLQLPSLTGIQSNYLRLQLLTAFVLTLAASHNARKIAQKYIWFISLLSSFGLSMVSLPL